IPDRATGRHPGGSVAPQAVGPPQLGENGARAGAHRLGAGGGTGCYRRSVSLHPRGDVARCLDPHVGRERRLGFLAGAVARPGYARAPPRRDPQFAAASNDSFLPERLQTLLPHEARLVGDLTAQLVEQWGSRLSSIGSTL